SGVATSGNPNPNPHSPASRGTAPGVSMEQERRGAGAAAARRSSYPVPFGGSSNPAWQQRITLSPAVVSKRRRAGSVSPVKRNAPAGWGGKPTSPGPEEQGLGSSRPVPRNLTVQASGGGRAVHTAAREEAAERATLDYHQYLQRRQGGNPQAPP
ncbi:unnamed protein product, partial [Laminaria digitata]